MGAMLEHGTGCEQNYSAAADWYRRAAAQGLMGAKVNLGIFLANGTGESRDPEQANALYREAIEGGSLGALWQLGLSYSRGQGVDNNYATALSYWQRAADQGHAQAATNVGQAYWKGQCGYAESLILAKKYTKIGAAKGDATAIHNLKLMTACAQCGADDAPGGVCAGCKQLHYCNRACQLLHWRDPLNPHKAHCGGIPAQDSRWRASDEAWLVAHTPPE